MIINLFLLIIFLNILVACCFILLNYNKIYTILYLIFIYMNVSVLMMYLGTTILGLFYFLVYIGAIAVLFLFSIMILNLKDFIYEYDYSVFINIFIFIVTLLFQLYLISFKFNFVFVSNIYEYFFSTNEYLLLLGLLIFNRYNSVLLFVALILLLAMIGSIHLTNKKKGFFIKKELFVLSRHYNVYHCLVY